MLFGLKLPSLGGGGAAQRASAKAELLDAISGLQRGLTAGPEERARVDELARRLEKTNPTRAPLASDLINGQWELLYTTSESILGSKRPPFLRPGGKIFQIIDAPGLRARNKEGPPLFNEVSADLIPQKGSSSCVDVQFDEFKLLGFIPIKAPASARGDLDTTYLDDDLRVSRGNRGNLFVLRMADRSVKP